MLCLNISCFNLSLIQWWSKQKRHAPSVRVGGLSLACRFCWKLHFIPHLDHSHLSLCGIWVFIYLSGHMLYVEWVPGLKARVDRAHFSYLDFVQTFLVFWLKFLKYNTCGYHATLQRPPKPHRWPLQRHKLNRCRKSVDIVKEEIVTYAIVWYLLWCFAPHLGRSDIEFVRSQETLRAHSFFITGCRLPAFHVYLVRDSV